MSDDFRDSGKRLDWIARWSALELPDLDGIVISDGRIRRMELNWSSDYRELAVRAGAWTNLVELESSGELDWVSVNPLCERSAPNLRLLAGEASYGEAGFVVVLPEGSGTPIWAAFFTESNPFEKIRLDGDYVVAETNLWMKWRFPLDAPENVTISNCPY